MPLHQDPALEAAMRSLAEASARAAADPRRPGFHFLPPAQWMNDPNGPIHHHDYYHLFYQHNPFGDGWDHMHWGHARSRDLVHWERLPIALRPSPERGEKHCFSGCCRLDGSGTPTILYTSVPPREGGGPHSQWIARGSEDLLHWEKPASNPSLDLATHGGPSFRGDWRDPYLFEHQGRTFLILGAVAEAAPDRPGIALYEAAGPDLARWSYRGMLFELPGDGKTFLECPALFPLGRKWVLLASAYRPVERWIGSLDLASYRFLPDGPEAGGLIDHSQAHYASTVFIDSRGRRLLLGWVRGFPPEQGWNGCLALPRTLRLDNADRILQEPVPELESLRAEHLREAPFLLEEGARVLGGATFAAEQLEIAVELEEIRAETVGLRLVPVSGEGPAVVVTLGRGGLDAAGSAIPAPRLGPPGRIALHAFFDRSVLELFVNRGEECVSRVVSVALPVRVELFARGGSARVRRAEAWKLRSIW